jgi:hypothetical protein
LQLGNMHGAQTVSRNAKRTFASGHKGKLRAIVGTLPQLDNVLTANRYSDQELPITIPVTNTITPPMTTWKIADDSGVSI